MGKACHLSYLRIARIACLICATIGSYPKAADAETNPVPEYNSPLSMSDCIKKTLSFAETNGRGRISDATEVSRLCYSIIREDGLLSDFNIRREIYKQQYAQSNILLYMVIFITISGVLMAGFQLIMSYRLSGHYRQTAAPETELIFKQDRLALRSSIVGLFILAFSLAFFIIFVRFVYKLEECDVSVSHAAAPAINLSPGTIDAPNSQAAP